MNIQMKRELTLSKTNSLTVCLKCHDRLKDSLLLDYRFVGSAPEGCQISDHSAHVEGDIAVCGFDGNAGFALLGENLQEGEAEFVTIAEPGGDYERSLALISALENLRKRLNMPNLPAKSVAS